MAPPARQRFQGLCDKLSDTNGSPPKAGQNPFLPRAKATGRGAREALPQCHAPSAKYNIRLPGHRKGCRLNPLPASCESLNGSGRSTGTWRRRQRQRLVPWQIKCNAERSGERRRCYKNLPRCHDHRCCSCRRRAKKLLRTEGARPQRGAAERPRLLGPCTLAGSAVREYWRRRGLSGGDSHQPPCHAGSELAGPNSGSVPRSVDSCVTEGSHLRLYSPWSASRLLGVQKFTGCLQGFAL